MTAATAVPAVLVLLAVVDAAFAGFRAATGRNGRIRKRAYNWHAARRGFFCGTTGLSVVALLMGGALAGFVHQGERYDELLRAGTRMLYVLTPFALVVLLSLLAYLLLPMRESTFVVLIGLGPFTLIRPVVVLGATVAAVAGSADWLVWAGALLAATSVLVVEPFVHRRWYREPV